MVSRLDRNRPLPDVLGGLRVEDSKTQRALDALAVSLRAVLQFLQPFVQPEEWAGLPFYGDWEADVSTLQVPEYKKDPFGRVSLRGWAKTAGGAQAVIAVLPSTHRPASRCSFTMFRLNGTYAVARVDVDTDGRVLLVTPAVAAGDELSLDGINFEVA